MDADHLPEMLGRLKLTALRDPVMRGASPNRQTAPWQASNLSRPKGKSVTDRRRKTGTDRPNS
ncbi:hypothetical protein, partial [Azospirillum argentinense]